MKRACFMIGAVLAPLACGGASSREGFGAAADAGLDSDVASSGAGSDAEAGVSSLAAPDPATCEEAARTRSYVGCEYWPVPLANIVGALWDFAVVVANTGSDVAEVEVSRAGDGDAGGFSLKERVEPGELKRIILPWVTGLQPVKNVPFAVGDMLSFRKNGGAYHLVSSRPVLAYQFNALQYRASGDASGRSKDCRAGECFSFSNDASLLLPTTAMTGSYRVAAYPMTPTDNGAKLHDGRHISPGYIAVSATEDNTLVRTFLQASADRILDNVADGVVGGTADEGPLEFALNRGDVIELTSTGDLSGTLVSADKPVQVFHGNVCAQVPAGRPACDHLEESMLPTETWGKEHVVAVPGHFRADLAGQFVRFYGHSDGTTLEYVNPPAGAPTRLRAGEMVDLSFVGTSFIVRGDKPFMVSTFLTGQGLSGVGDPSQSIVIATENHRQRYLFLAPADYDFNYADIVARHGTTIVLDGASLKSTPNFIGAGWVVYHERLGPGRSGAHDLVANAPVGLQVIGYGDYTSYQYPGGMSLHNKTAFEGPSR